MSKKEEKEELRYFWNLKGENFAGKSFGADVTDILVDQEARRNVMLSLGKIVSSKPVDFDSAKENELNSLRAAVKKLQENNSDLKSKLKKGGGAKSGEAAKLLEAKLEKIPKNIKEANEKIQILESKVGDLETELSTEKEDATKLLEAADAEILELKSKIEDGEDQEKNKDGE